jgi:hypothetical protein
MLTFIFLSLLVFGYGSSFASWLIKLVIETLFLLSFLVGGMFLILLCACLNIGSE